MIQAYRINENNIYVEPVIVADVTELSSKLVATPPLEGVYRAKWTGIEWKEDMTQDEIDELNNRPKELTEEQRRILDLEVAMAAILGGVV